MSAIHNRRDHTRPNDRWQLGVAWFLTLSYLIGSPAFSILELRTGLISTRFGYPPVFLYAVGLTQFICASVLFVRSLAPWSCVILDVLAIGAVVSHISIGSPLTGIPALVYVLAQTWYGVRVYRQNRAVHV